MSSFADKLITQQGGLVRFITANERGRAGWYYLKLFPESYQEYCKKIKSGDLTLNHYGEIIARGEGTTPPAEVAQRMLDDYQCPLPKMDDK
jgi:hypothetical protein